MNCIDKMYKEIEEILLKEQKEAAHANLAIKEIKHAFEPKTTILEESIQYNYLNSVTYNQSDATKKYFDEQKAIKFIEFIFKKYVCLYGDSHGEGKFANEVINKISPGEDLILKLNSLENEFVNLIGDSEEVQEYFLNPYNALFKDENGYFAVILDGKFSDVKKPFKIIENQTKKNIKSFIEEYALDFKTAFKSEKELNIFLNNLKAEINKCNDKNPLELQEFAENKLFEELSKRKITRQIFDNYLDEKGLRLIKNGKFYFKEKEYLTYSNYKKIEFRY